MKRRFAKFFMKQTQNSATLMENRLHGWLENERIEVFQNEDDFNCLLLEDLRLYAGIKGKLYLVEERSLNAILAFYEGDSEILWLDNHDDNVDFSTFIKREKLLNWLPDKAAEFADLLVRTKLNYLGWPETIHDVSNVSRTEDELRELRSRSKEDRDMILEEEQRLASIAGKIHSPVCVLTNETFRLDFYIWTGFEGRVINIQCHIGTDGSFDYQGTQLTEAVGDWFVPR